MDIQLFDHVELVADLPDFGLRVGEKGTVVDVFTDPKGYDVEFPGFVIVDVKPEDIRLMQKHRSPATA